MLVFERNKINILLIECSRTYIAVQNLYLLPLICQHHHFNDSFFEDEKVSVCLYWITYLMFFQSASLMEKENYFKHIWKVFFLSSGFANRNSIWLNGFLWAFRINYLLHHWTINRPKWKLTFINIIAVLRQLSHPPPLPPSKFNFSFHIFCISALHLFLRYVMAFIYSISDM